MRFKIKILFYYFAPQELGVRDEPIFAKDFINCSDHIIFLNKYFTKFSTRRTPNSPFQLLNLNRFKFDNLLYFQNSWSCKINSIIHFCLPKKDFIVFANFSKHIVFCAHQVCFSDTIRSKKTRIWGAQIIILAWTDSVCSTNANLFKNPHDSLANQLDQLQAKYFKKELLYRHLGSLFSIIIPETWVLNLLKEIYTEFLLSLDHKLKFL